MKKKLIALLLVAICMVETVLYSEEPSHRSSIRVQIFEKVSGALVEVKGPYNVYDPKSQSKLDIVFAPSAYYMYPTKDGIKWGQEFPGVYQLLIIPDSPDVTTVVGGKEYQGTITVYQFDGALGFVNEVSLDAFTASELSSKLRNDTLSEEVLAAIAIGCRTDAVFYAKHPENPYWDIAAKDFGYEGYALVRHDTDFIKAMKSTKGMVLVEEKTMQPLHPQWIKRGESIPFQDISAKCQEDASAKECLEQLFPKSKIVLASELT